MCSCKSNYDCLLIYFLLECSFPYLPSAPQSLPQSFSPSFPLSSLLSIPRSPPIHLFNKLALRMTPCMSTCIYNIIRRSFLYYLDGRSQLLRPIVSPFHVKLDHVAVGFSHAVVVSSDHQAFSWGQGSHGQLGHGDTNPRSSPQLIDSLSSSPIIRWVWVWSL